MRWKRLLLDNLGTKLMAMILAVLLWIYLYNESTDSDEFDAAFSPAIEGIEELSGHEVLASDGRPLGPLIRIKITGPKGPLSALSKVGVRCKPRFERTLFREPQGSVTRDLTIADLNLPEGFRVLFHPSPQITVRYVKFIVAKVPVVLRDPPTEGKCVDGFQVGPVLFDPKEVELRFPANRAVTEAPLKRVSVQDRAESFDKGGELDLPDGLVTLRTPVTLRIRIQRHHTAKERFDKVPLHLVGSNPKLLSRLELVDKTLTVEVTGSDQAVQAIKSTHTTDLFAFVVIDLDDGAKAGKYPQSKIYCHVLNEQYRNDLTVTIMPDIQAENRTVNVKVNPE